MAPARRRWFLGCAVGVILLLFVGRWGAGIAVERWWAAGVAPGALGLLGRWQWLRAALEVGGILVAGAWCVGHLLLVVRSIGTVQVPQRVGDLEIREVVSGEFLRPGAILIGLAGGALLGAGAGRFAAPTMLAWHGTVPTAADPLLGLDLGVYLVHLPLWEALVDGGRRLTWSALVVVTLAHALVGGIRSAHPGLAMGETARRQVGLLAALALVLAAFGEALGPLRAVAGLDADGWASLSASWRWMTAGIWAAAAVFLAWWAFRPNPRRLVVAFTLWGAPFLVGSVSDLMVREAPPVDRSFGASIMGVGAPLQATHQATGPVPKVGPGLWGRQVLPQLIGERAGVRLLAAAPIRSPSSGASIPSWLLLREDSGGRTLVMIADDRLAPGGGVVSFREGDPVAYPGVVTWRAVPALVVVPGGTDSLTPGTDGGLRVGGPFRRLIVAWGSQSRAAISATTGEATLLWRRTPRDRVAHLFPMAWWDEPRPYLHQGRLLWAVDGWSLSEGAPFATEIPWDGGVVVRYARRWILALVDAESGAVRFYRRPDGDAIGNAWADIAGSMILPADSIPAGLLEGSPGPRVPAVAALAMRPGTGLPEVGMAWGPRGPVYAAVLPVADRGEVRVPGLLFELDTGGYLVVRWPEGAGPFTSRALERRWGGFASLERLEDSIRTAGGRLEKGDVRYDVTTRWTLAVRVRWAVAANGTPTVAWVEVAQGDRLGAARTPATALANMLGESAPLVPEPDVPDRITEARRWASRADSALRAGDLEGFGRAFEALKRVLGTP